MMKETSITDVSPVLKKAVAKGIFEVSGLYDTPVALFYDLDLWDSHLKNLKDAFGPTFQHTIAMKSNPITAMLNHAYNVHKVGVECASIGELQQALLNCMLPRSKIVFDSPCKTKAELEYSIKEKIHCNLDNFEEFERAKDYIENNSLVDTGIIGVRINPLVGAGDIAALSVSTNESKFGIPITQKKRIIDCFLSNAWLNSVHVHVGSGGMGVTLLTAGIKIAVELANEVNTLLERKQVKVIDIGGGLPANYKSDEWGNEKVPTFDEYATHLKQEVSELFNGKFLVVTEFGQSINAKCGFLASKIEWIKGSEANPICIIHFGADCCVRQVYSNDHKRRLEAYQGDGSRFPEDHEKKLQCVGGPLCFQGDLVGKDIMLPQGLKSGDYIIMKDAGANTLSLFSRHCSRLCPPVYGYRWEVCGEIIKELIELKPREDIGALFSFWGPLI